MKNIQTEIMIESPARGIYDITKQIAEVVENAAINTGVCHLFIQHTSASLIITENTDPDVRKDIEYWMKNAIKDGDEHYRHNDEGDDDMSAHIRCMITDMSQTIPITQGRLNLGIWQGLFLYEHRTGRFQRKIVITLQGV